MDNEYSYNFGNNLKRIRKEKGFSQKQLADLIGMERSSISYMESNKREPTYSLLKKLSTALNVRVNELLGTSEILDPWGLMTENEFENFVIKDTWNKSLINEITQMLNMLNGNGLWAIYTCTNAFLHDDFYRLEPSENYVIQQQFQEKLDQEYEKALKIFIKIFEINNPSIAMDYFNDYLINNHLSPLDFIEKYKED